MLFILLFLFGLAIGSFLNVLADRLPRGESVVWERSHCDYCQHKLAWFDLIPVFSFYSLGGRCRYCKKKLSGQYPFVEITTGLLFVLVFILSVNLSPTLSSFLYMLLIACCLFVIVLADVRYHIIPDQMIIILVVLAVAHRLVLPLFAGTAAGISPANALLSGLSLVSVFAGLVWITRGKGMGWGDVKYAFWMGLFLGFPRSIVAFYVAFLTGAAISLILIGWRKKTLKSVIPFGPFLIGATIVSFFWGQGLWNWLLAYMSLPV